MYPAGSEDMSGGRAGPDADGLGQMEMFEDEGGGDRGAQGHNNSSGYSSNPWKNAVLEFEYILVSMCLCCRMLAVVVTSLESM